MFIVLYRRVKPEKEEQFTEAWAEITRYFREKFDSLGSRLHKGNDGLFYGYAQWKSAEDREKAFFGSDLTAESNAMQEAVEEKFPEVVLEKISDFLV